MDTLKFRLNTVERSIILENIQMTQDRFSYNNIAFAKESENSVKVIYKQEIVEDSQETKDIGLSWALSTMYRALAQYKDHIFIYQ